MSLLGSAALAMWWDVAADLRVEFEHWHAHEHFQERLCIPGFRRASRWTSAEGGEGFFVMYELADYEILAAVPKAALKALQEAAKESGAALTEIGMAGAGEGTELLGADGRPFAFRYPSFSHF